MSATPTASPMAATPSVKAAPRSAGMPCCTSTAPKTAAKTEPPPISSVRSTVTLAIARGAGTPCWTAR